MKIIVNGACGHMGRALIAAAESKDIEIVAKVDKYGDTPFKEISEYKGCADAVVDFSHHTAAPALCAYAEERGLPLVIATTGHTEEEADCIRKAAQIVPVFYSANMSLGIALLIDLAKKAAAVFPDADIEIVEVHHNRKLDAPSGTAKMILDGILEVYPDRYGNFGRAGMGQREKKEIGVQSVRMGNVVGVHEVHICTGTQCLTLKHEAQSRDLFAEGALEAASFLLEKKPGLYVMKDLI